MTITEANAVAALLHAIDGTSTHDDDQLREAATLLADRAGQALQMRVDVEPYAVDAFLLGRAGGR